MKHEEQPMAETNDNQNSLTLRQIARIHFIGAAALTLPGLVGVAWLLILLYLSVAGALDGSSSGILAVLSVLAVLFLIPVLGFLLMRDYRREMKGGEPKIPRKRLWVLSAVYNIIGGIGAVCSITLGGTGLTWGIVGLGLLFAWCCVAATLSVRAIGIAAHPVEGELE